MEIDIQSVDLSGPFLRFGAHLLPEGIAGQKTRAGEVPVYLTRLTCLTGCTACFAKRQKLRAGVSSNSLPFLTLRMPTPCNKQDQNGTRSTGTPPALAADGSGEAGCCRVARFIVPVGSELEMPYS